MTNQQETPDLAKAYDHRQVEERRYQWWRENGFFHAPTVPGRPAFTMMMPPPNVTGVLHVGHALDNAPIDILTRYHRMLGEPALFLPGTDHAGLATQVKVEEHLRAMEGKTRHDLGRAAFVQRVWDWKEQRGSHITRQLTKLGLACDWDRERFTFDAGMSRAVRAFFVRLYNKGLIYRGTRMIHWCPNDQTALSDIEVEHEERQGHLWHVRYPLADGSADLTVATTRPETLLGDTAVAVHPGDARYTHLIGRELLLPLVGRRIPIIADDAVDPAFGTGCVKVTPAHDPTDYAMGQRHALPLLQVIGPDGRMTAEAGAAYAGLDRYACRERVVADLAAQGFLVATEAHVHNVGTCDRCHAPVEPMVSTQWFVKMAPLAGPAIDAVSSGAVRILPEHFAKIYLHWLENIQDWCISRQIWWGHRIPVWYCQECGHQTCAEEDPTACAACGSHRIEQDPDGLDTWFSSALWPFATLGWPDAAAPDLRAFYPTQVLSCGHEILFFWVARMIFAGLELTGQAPFHTVLIHGIVRDSEGRKMSKSLGNGVDPLDVIGEYGADALRYAVCTAGTWGQDSRYRSERVADARNFANKLYNASRFVRLNLADYDPAGPVAYDLADRWIRSRLARVIETATAALDAYDFGLAAVAVRDFLWEDFCDWYIELVKPRLYGKQSAELRRGAQATLVQVLDATLRLLHPLMPFVTEEIWQALPLAHEQVVTAPAGAPASLMCAPWPVPLSGALDAAAEAQLAAVQAVVRAIRNLRAELNVPAGRAAEVLLEVSDPAVREALAACADFLAAAPQHAVVRFVAAGAARPAQAATAVVPGVAITLPLAGLLDLDAERQRLAREIAAVAAELERAAGKLANPNFLAKAAPEAVAKERAKEAELAERLAALEGRLRLLAGE